MAKRKCTKFGKSHGRKVCRKFSGGKASKRKSSRAIATPGIGKAIRVAGRKACSNPERAASAQDILNYIRASASVEMRQGVQALGKTAARRRLRGLSKSLRGVQRLGRTCAKQAARAAKRAA